MTAKLAYDEYKKNKVVTASGVELIIQLYDEAIKNIQVAKAIINRRSILSYKEIKDKSQALSKSVNIVTGLADSLDLEKGGEIAINLGKLYEFVNMRLLNGNMNNNPVMLEEALRVLNELREAWVSIVKQGHRGKGEEANKVQEKTEVPFKTLTEGEARNATLYNRFALKA